MRARAHLNQPRQSFKRRRISVVAILTSVLMLGTALPASSLPSVTDSPTPEPSAVQSSAEPTTEEAPSPAETSALEETPEPSGTPEGTWEAPTPPQVAPSTTEGTDETPGSTPDAGSATPEASAADDVESEDATAAEEDGISILAAGPDGAQPPYVYWTATDQDGALLGGATFQIQGPRDNRTIGWNSGDTNNQRWNANQATVTDCTAAPCAGPDLDPDPGEFLVKSLVGHDVRADRRYRVRQETAPAGYQMRNDNDNYRQIPGFGENPSQGAWQDLTYGFGAFVNDELVGKALSCATGTFYSISSDGTVREVDNGTVVSPSFGNWGGGLSAMNGLAIGENGSVAYAYERTGSNNKDVEAIYRYTAATGVWEELPGTEYVTQNNGSLVTGAVNLSNGRYLFGGFHNPGPGNNKWFMLYEFNPATNAISYLGYIDTGLERDATPNGDMAFDSLGNLYIVRSGATTNIITVTAATLASANGGQLARSVTNSMSLSLSNVNGIAFAADGTVYLGNGSTVYRYNPAKWEQVGNRVTNQLSSSTDLASCSSPASLTVQKNIVGRVAAADQFRLTLSQGTTQIATATTTGSALGVQADQIGPVPAQTGTSYTITEAMAPGSASSLSQYATSYVCADDDGTLSSGTSATGSVTIPDKPGVAVVCTFTNSPLVATININKVELDAEGLNPQPGGGWTVGAAANATTGNATLDPSASTQQTDTVTGSATWRVNFNASNARATVNVSETQQSGYAFVDGECTVTPLGGEPGDPISLPDEDGTAIPGVAPGDTVDCTFTNKLSPTNLTLVKEVSFGDAEPTVWTLQATGPSGSLPGPNGTTGSDPASAEVTPGVAYTLSESGGPDIYIQDGDWTCQTDSEEPVTVTESRVTLASGDDVTCTVNNATALLTLLKHVEDPALDPGDWELTAEPDQVTGLDLGTETVAGADAESDENTFHVRPNHSYTISEALASQTGVIAFRALGIEQLVDGEWVPVNSDEVELEPGEHATYRFVNDSLPEIRLPLTGGLASDAFLIGGAGVLLLALALAAVQRRRRNEVRL